MGLRKFEEIEEREGRPMRDVLTGLFEQYPNQSIIAAKLGVTQSTLSSWVYKVGLRQWTILVPAGDRAKADEESAPSLPLPGFELLVTVEGVGE